jgi:hypothetical protein
MPHRQDERKTAIVVDHDLRIIFTEQGNYQDVTLPGVGLKPRES